MRKNLFEGDQIDYQVLAYFENLGFKDICLSSNWRHIVGSVTRDDQRYFVKLATTPDVGKSTQNEYIWNLMMGQKVRFSDPHISIPISYEQGYYNGLFWFTSQFINGEPLAHPKDPYRTQLLEQNLDLIAKTACDLMLLRTDDGLSSGNLRPSSQELASIFSRLESWLADSYYQATDVLAYLKLHANDVAKSPIHGDYVPWHILVDHSNIAYLIDSEHASVDGYKFYDIAYCYHRLYTKFKRPELLFRQLSQRQGGRESQSKRRKGL